MEVKVSVVMCTYNGAKFIREQIDTILAQTYPLYEFLIFDDASEDETYSILEGYAANNKIIRVYQNKINIGFSNNFKNALLTAKGDVIALADQDDIWQANKIERMLSEWDETSLLIYCNSIRIKDQIPVNLLPDAAYRRFEGTNAKKIFLFNTVSGHAMMIKKQLIDIAFPLPDEVYYDWWFAIVAAYNGGVKYVEETLVFQRVHSNNVTIEDGLDHTQKEQRNAFKKMVIKHLKKFKKAPNIPFNDKNFLDKFLIRLERSVDKKFYLPLLIFLIKNCYNLFFHKNKKFRLPSYIKYAYRLTFNYGK
jgi:glycosyltransferase involved in cell wall biosynthesis